MLFRTFPQGPVAIHPLYSWLLVVWSIVGIIWIAVLPYLLGTYAYATGVVDPNGPTAPRAQSDFPGPILPWTFWKIWRLSKGLEEPEEPAEPATERFEVEIRQRRALENGTTRVTAATLLSGPNAIARARNVAQRLANGTALSEASLTGRGKPLRQSEWEAFRRNLISHRLAEWIDPDAHTQGTQLTALGLETMRAIAGYPPTPPKEIEGRVRRGTPHRTNDERTNGRGPAGGWGSRLRAARDRPGARRKRGGRLAAAFY